MNYTLMQKEWAMDVQMQSLSIERPAIHYWHIERKAKRGKKWIFVQRFYLTKAQMAETWCKYYRESGNYRLVHLLKY